MVIRRFLVILASGCLLALLACGGCTEQMRRDLDRTARGAAAGGKAGRDAMHSPAGELVPEPVRSAVLAGFSLVELVGLAWLNSRRKQTDTKLAGAQTDASKHRDTLACIVKAVEGMPVELQGVVKDYIASTMAKDSEQNALIDTLKSGGSV